MDLELKNYRELIKVSDEYYKFLQKEGYSKDDALWIVYNNRDKIAKSIIKN